MPFVAVRSLPFDPPVETATVLGAITADLERASGIEAEHITVTWEYLERHHYAAGGLTTGAQPRDSHPVLVELFAPDFYAPETVTEMLASIARSIAAHTPIAFRNVFVSYRSATSGQVFEDGDLVRW